MKITLRQLFLLLSVAALLLAIFGRPLALLWDGGSLKYFLAPFWDLFWLARLESILPTWEFVYNSDGLPTPRENGERCMFFTGLFASVLVHIVLLLVLVWFLGVCVPNWWDKFAHEETQRADA